MITTRQNYNIFKSLYSNRKKTGYIRNSLFEPWFIVEQFLYCSLPRHQRSSWRNGLPNWHLCNNRVTQYLRYYFISLLIHILNFIAKIIKFTLLTTTQTTYVHGIVNMLVTYIINAQLPRRSILTLSREETTVTTPGGL